MRNFKFFLWIFIIFLIQTVIAGRVHLFGAAPSLVLALVICVMIMENEFRIAAAVSIICAVAMGALGGRNFIITTLFYVISSIIIFALRKKPAYVNNCAKSVAWTAAASAAAEVLYALSSAVYPSLSLFTHDVIPTAVFNAVLAVILYPILKKTMYKEEKTKLLIV
jgi:cell shape-determining protein MreD